MTSKKNHILRFFLFFFCLTALPLVAKEEKDPLNSPIWKYLKENYFPEVGQIYKSDKIKVFAPDYAEDPSRVPASVDLRDLGKAKRIVVIADLNPIQKIIEFTPGEEFENYISFYFRIQQRSPLRVLAQTEDGKWYMNGKWVDSIGGGCTAPSVHYVEANWDEFGEIRGMINNRPSGKKLKFSINHPMDSGFVDGIPEFYVEQISFAGKSNQKAPKGKLQLFQSVSRDPVISLMLNPDFQGKALKILARDNSGNDLSGTAEPVNHSVSN